MYLSIRSLNYQCIFLMLVKLCRCIINQFCKLQVHTSLILIYLINWINRLVLYIASVHFKYTHFFYNCIFNQFNELQMYIFFILLYSSNCIYQFNKLHYNSLFLGTNRFYELYASISLIGYCGEPAISLHSHTVPS